MDKILVNFRERLLAHRNRLQDERLLRRILPHAHKRYLFLSLTWWCITLVPMKLCCSASFPWMRPYDSLQIYALSRARAPTLSLLNLRHLRLSYSWKNERITIGCTKLMNAYPQLHLFYARVADADAYLRVDRQVEEVEELRVALVDLRNQHLLVVLVRDVLYHQRRALVLVVRQDLRVLFDVFLTLRISRKY